MKFIIKALIVVFIITVSSSSIFVASNSRILRRIKSKGDNAGCPTIVGRDAAANIDNTKDIYPGDTQILTPEAKANAELQTKAARSMFYLPPESVKIIVKNVSLNYMKMVANNKKETDTDVFSLFGQIQRQTGEAGTWQVFNAFKVQHNLDEQMFHADVIARLEGGTNFTASDLLGFMGFIGDLGACLQDSINRPLSAEDNKMGTQKFEEFKIKKRIGYVLKDFFGDALTAKSQKFYADYSPDKYYDNGNQGKKKERSTCSTTENTMKLDPRAGVLGVGKDIDDKITVGNQSASRLKAENQLPQVGWPWQTVPKKLVEFCPKEPWAGHFSGSLYELILMLELFDRPDPKKESNPTVEKKKAYAAMAAAFLMATGMHSAVELVYVVKNYTGVASYTPEKIISSDICSNASRDVAKFITELP